MSLARLLPLALLATLMLGGATAEAATTRRAGLRMSLPGTFKPVPTAHARRDAGTLVTLLKRAGLRAASTIQVRQDRAGSPLAPQATLTAARVRVLTPSLGTAPTLPTDDLQDVLEGLAEQDETSVLLEPKARKVAGQSGIELGWTSTLADGRRRMQRLLLVPRKAEVLVLALHAQDTDLTRWDAAWASATQSLALEAQAASKGSFPWSAASFAVAGLAALALLAWLVRSGRWRGIRRLARA